MEIFIGLILIIFFGLFAVMALPMKNEVSKLNNKVQQQSQKSSLHDS